MSVSVSTSSFSSKPQDKKSKYKRKKPHKYRELITHLQCCTTAPLSYREQAKIVGCSEIFAKEVTRENLAAKIITKTSTTYNFSGQTLTGKNVYGRGEAFDPNVHLIDDLELKITKEEITTRWGVRRTILVRKFIPRKAHKNSKNNYSFSSKTENHTPNTNKKKNLSKDRFAIDKHQEFSSSFDRNNYKKDFFKHKFDILKSYGFEELAKKAPAWWFKDLKKLKKALKLLRSKQKGKFRCHDPFKFLCFLMKHGVFGYRRHVARNLSLAVTKPSINRVLPFLETEPIRQTYDALVKLRKSHGLKMDFTSVQKLLRKKFPHLTAATEVCLKRLSFEGAEKILNVNGFLNYLVGLTNPHDYLKRKEV